MLYGLLNEILYQITIQTFPLELIYCHSHSKKKSNNTYMFNTEKVEISSQNVFENKSFFKYVLCQKM